jgi:hypothetical protein
MPEEALMAERKVSDEQYQADLKAAAQAGAEAAVNALRDWDDRFKTSAPAPSSAEDAFHQAANFRELAEKKAISHQWRAFRTAKGAIGVAYITDSKTHAGGRVIKFESYEKPPEVQMPFTEQKFDASGAPTERFKAWQYQEYYRDDARVLCGASVEKLPDAGPPRVSLDATKGDVEERRARRDAEFYKHQVQTDPTVPHQFLGLPAPVPVTP